MKKKIMLFITSLIISINLFCITASAATTTSPTNDLENTKLVTGTKDLLGDIALVFTGVSLLICVAFVAYCLIRRMLAKNQEKDEWNGRIFTAVVCTIVIPLISGLLQQ